MTVIDSQERHLKPVESARSSSESPSEPDVDDPDATHAAIWVDLDRLGHELARTWPDGLSAVDAIREDRGRLDVDPPQRQVGAP